MDHSDAHAGDLGAGEGVEREVTCKLEPTQAPRITDVGCRGMLCCRYHLTLLCGFNQPATWREDSQQPWFWEGRLGSVQPKLLPACLPTT